MKRHHQSITPQDLELLRDWIGQTSANRQLAEEMLKVLGQTDIDQNMRNKYNSKVAWAKVEGRIVQHPRMRYLIPPVLRWAAAAVLMFGLVGVAFWTTKKTNPIVQQITVSTKGGESKKILLPDGTRIWINENSVLSYPKEFTDSVRTVQLTGEAFLEVTHNPQQPFIIKGTELETRVLGTSFNLKLRDNDNSVMVVTGKVRFSYRMGTKKKSIVVEKGYQALTGQSGDLTLSWMANQNKLAWHTGLLEFNNEKLAEVVKELSAFYRVPIQLQAINSQNNSFTGTIQQLPVEVALETVCYSLHLRWAKTTQGYLITNE